MVINYNIAPATDQSGMPIWAFIQETTKNQTPQMNGHCFLQEQCGKAYKSWLLAKINIHMIVTRA